MKYKIIEATAKGYYLKALIGRFTREDWSRRAEAVYQETGEEVCLLACEGLRPDRSFFIMDLSSGTGGAKFHLGGLADADVKKAPAVT